MPSTDTTTGPQARADANRPTLEEERVHAERYLDRGWLLTTRQVAVLFASSAASVPTHNTIVARMRRVGARPKRGVGTGFCWAAADVRRLLLHGTGEEDLAPSDGDAFEAAANAGS